METATSWSTSDATSEALVCMKNISGRDVRVPVNVECNEQHSLIDAVTREEKTWTIKQKEIVLLWKPGQMRMVPRHVWHGIHRVKNCQGSPGHEGCKAFCTGDPTTIDETAVLSSGLAPAQLVLADPHTGVIVQKYALHRSLVPVEVEQVPETISPADLASAQRAVPAAMSASDNDPVMARARQRRAQRGQS